MCYRLERAKSEKGQKKQAELWDKKSKMIKHNIQKKKDEFKRRMKAIKKENQRREAGKKAACIFCFVLSVLPCCSPFLFTFLFTFFFNLIPVHTDIKEKIKFDLNEKKKVIARRAKIKEHRATIAKGKAEQEYQALLMQHHDA